MDEQLLFEYYLIANEYGQKQHFKLEVVLYMPQEQGRADYHRISTYGYMQTQINQLQGDVRYLDNHVQKMQLVDLNGVKRLVPLFSVQEESLTWLKKPIDDLIWRQIQNGQSSDIKTFEGMLYRMCWSFLFYQIGTGNKYLSEQRKEVFSTDEFREMIKGIPLIALLIFSMLDYAFREEAIKEYKEEIKKRTNKQKININIEDLVYEYQNRQDRAFFDAYTEVCRRKYDSKTIWEDYDKRKIHPYIIKELYEAVSISEGIIQLLDNVVKHASENNKGKGMCSLFLRSYEKDKKTLEEKYNNYFSRNEKDEKSKYYLEIIIADLSGTDIPTKFIENNKFFFEVNKDKLMKQMKEVGTNLGIPPAMELSDFFQPSKEMRDFWQAFFSFDDKAVNHYGLQIFDSIISSKHGLFEVESGSYYYCNIKGSEKERNRFVHGSKYTIFCPLNGVSTDDNNIYDSMFRYSYENIEKEIKKMPIIEKKNSEDYIKDVFAEFNKIKWYGGSIVSVDTRDIRDLENFVKGMLLYIFEFKEKEENMHEQLLISFLHCKPHQIIDIVRILSIYYDKLGQNIKMKGVQVYLRGEKIGEEILFHGNDLQEVSRNIAKSSCMRGTMFDNFQTVNKMLEREKRSQNE